MYAETVIINNKYLILKQIQCKIVGLTQIHFQ